MAGKRKPNPIKEAKETLALVFDKVQHVKGTDRFIVGNKEDLWGVVDIEGNEVIPLKYTRITTTGGSYFKAYGNKVFTTYSVMSEIDVKEQTLFDINGKVLHEHGAFSTSKLLLERGILFGQNSDSRYYVPKKTDKYTGALYLDFYTGKVYEIPSVFTEISISEVLPGIILLGFDERVISEEKLKEASNCETGIKVKYEPNIELYGFRYDTTDDRDIEIKPLKDCCDTCELEQYEGVIDENNNVVQKLTNAKTNFSQEIFREICRIKELEAKGKTICYNECKLAYIPETVSVATIRDQEIIIDNETSMIIHFIRDMKHPYHKDYNFKSLYNFDEYPGV